MQRFLDSQSNRLLEIIELLIDAPEGLTPYQIAKQLKVSVRTIQHDVFSINQRFSKLFEIQQSTRFQYVLYERSKQILIDVLQELLKESLSVQLLTMILTDNSRQVTNYEQDLFVSTSTIRRIIKDINFELQSLRIKVVQNKKTYQITAEDEFVMRAFCAILFRSCYSVDEFPKTKALWEIFNSGLFRLGSSKFDRYRQTYVVWLLYVSMLREEQGINTEITDCDEAENKAIVEAIHNVFPQVSKAIILSVVKDIQHLLIENTESDEAVIVRQQSNLLMSRVTEIIDIKFSKEEQDDFYHMILQLIIADSVFPYYRYEYYDRIANFGNQLRKNNPELCQTVFSLVMNFSQEQRLMWINYIDYFLYFICMSDPSIIYQTKHQVKALLVCDFSDEHTEFLKSCISAFINQTYPILLVDTYTISGTIKEVTGDYDLIISTLPAIRLVSKTLTFIVDDCISLESLTQLMEIVANIHHGKS